MTSHILHIWKTYLDSHLKILFLSLLKTGTSPPALDTLRRSVEHQSKRAMRFSPKPAGSRGCFYPAWLFAGSTIYVPKNECMIITDKELSSCFTGEDDKHNCQHQWDMIIIWVISHFGTLPAELMLHAASSDPCKFVVSNQFLRQIWSVSHRIHTQ